MCGFSCKKKERKVLNSPLYSLTHRNARILKLVSLRVRRIRMTFSFGASNRTRTCDFALAVPKIACRLGAPSDFDRCAILTSLHLPPAALR